MEQRYMIQKTARINIGSYKCNIFSKQIQYWKQNSVTFKFCNKILIS